MIINTTKYWTKQFFIRLFCSSVLIGIAAFFTPGFTFINSSTLLIPIFLLTIIDFLLIRYIAYDFNSFGKFIIHFTLASIILYSTQYFISDYAITLFTALVGSLIFAISCYYNTKIK